MTTLLHKSSVTSLLVATAFGAMIVSLFRAGEVHPFDLRIVSLRDVEGEREVTLELTRLGPKAMYCEEQSIEFRVDGDWSPQAGVPKLERAFFLNRVNTQQITLQVPQNAHACRIMLSYRVGGSPYCRFYGFLSRHGLRKKFPNLSRYALDRTPRRPRLRTFRRVVPIPTQPDDASSLPPPPA